MNFTNGDTFRIYEIVQRILNELRQVIRQVLMTDVVEIVVVWILRHTPVKVCPRQDVHCILLVLYGLDGDFSQEVIVQHVRWQVRFNRQAFRKELLIKVLAGLLAHKDTSTSFILHWATGTTHHLQNIHDGVVDVSVFLAFIVLDTHDNDHVTGHGQAPCGILAADQ
jgi:hypothetical protein